jgi:hypothetical protein
MSKVKTLFAISVFALLSFVFAIWSFGYIQGRYEAGYKAGSNAANRDNKLAETSKD